MHNRPLPQLAHSPIRPTDPEFTEIAGWPYADPFIGRLLRDDIPQRTQYHDCCLWVFRSQSQELVGFGTLMVSDEWSQLTSDRLHPYIPLLATHPDQQGRGFGSAILRHLVVEAARMAAGGQRCCDTLVLDAYTDSLAAIALYKKCGFEQIAGPFADSAEGGKLYIVMARRVST